MGLCLCKNLIEDDLELAELHKLEIAMKVLRSRIKAKNMPIIWLEGTEGSGKQNHACNIAERFGYFHIQVDKAIKDEAEKKSRKGRFIRSKIMRQAKIPDRLVIELIKERMVTTHECNGFLISGFPQNPKQARYFVREIAPVDCILYLEGEASDIPPIENVGDTKQQKGNEEGDSMAIQNKSETSIMAGKYDFILEIINANEPPADVFMKIEAAILDRTSNTNNILD